MKGIAYSSYSALPVVSGELLNAVYLYRPPTCSAGANTKRLGSWLRTQHKKTDEITATSGPASAAPSLVAAALDGQPSAAGHVRLSGAR